MTRQEANQVILKILIDYINTAPDVRFSQALSNLSIVEESYTGPSSNWQDEFYLEPQELLKRMTGK